MKLIIKNSKNDKVIKEVVLEGYELRPSSFIDCEELTIDVDPVKKPTGRMKILPEIGTEYWKIEDKEFIYVHTFDNEYADLENFILGNMYHDKESAEKAKPEYLAWLNSTAKVLSRIAELNPEGWEPDWRLEGMYCFYLNSDYEVKYDSWSNHRFQLAPYIMSNAKIAEQILAEMPEDVERMIRR